MPLAIAEACADVALLARELALAVDGGSAGDVEAAALLAAGAARSAAHLVEINLVVTPSDARLQRARAAVQTAGA